MKELKLSCSKCHFEFFFTTVANDKAGHLPVPFDISPFSFTPTMTARPHKRNLILGSIRYLHISSNTPCFSLKHFVYALSSISLGMTIIPSEIKKLTLCKIWGGGGQIRCIMGNAQMTNAIFEKQRLHLRTLVNSLWTYATGHGWQKFLLSWKNFPLNFTFLCIVMYCIFAPSYSCTILISTTLFKLRVHKKKKKKKIRMEKDIL